MKIKVLTRAMYIPTELRGQVAMGAEEIDVPDRLVRPNVPDNIALEAVFRAGQEATRGPSLSVGDWIIFRGKVWQVESAGFRAISTLGE